MKSQFIGRIVGTLLIAACGRQADSPPTLVPTPPPDPAPVRDTRVESYQLLEKCAKDAHDWYKREWADAPASNMTSNYTNHYNAKLGRCFLVVTSTLFGKDKKTGAMSTMQSQTLLDVLENRDIGVFDQPSNRTTPMQCEVSGTTCTSDDQWEALAKPYMEELESDSADRHARQLVKWARAPRGTG